MVEWPLISSFTIHYWIIGVHSALSFNSQVYVTCTEGADMVSLFSACICVSRLSDWLCSSVCWYINQRWPTWVLVVSRNLRTLLDCHCLSLLALTVGWHDTFQIELVLSSTIKCPSSSFHSSYCTRVEQKYNKHPPALTCSHASPIFLLFGLHKSI